MWQAHTRLPHGPRGCAEEWMDSLPPYHRGALVRAREEVLPIPAKDGTCDLGVGDWGSVVGVNNGPADVRRHSDSCPPHRAARRRGAAAAENVTHRGFRSGQPYHVLGAV